MLEAIGVVTGGRSKRRWKACSTCIRAWLGAAWSLKKQSYVDTDVWVNAGLCSFSSSQELSRAVKSCQEY